MGPAYPLRQAPAGLLRSGRNRASKIC